MKKKKKLTPEERAKTLSVLILLFPSLLLAIIPSTINGDAVSPLFIKILLFIYQYSIINNYVKSH